MKNLLLIFLSLVLFVRCSKDSNTEPPKTDVTIIGKWYYVSDTVKGNRFPYIPGGGRKNDNCNIQDDYLEFTADGNLDAYYFEYCKIWLNDKYRYVLKDKSIFLYLKKDDKLDDQWKIIELTSTKMILEHLTDYDNDHIIDSVLMEFKR